MLWLLAVPASADCTGSPTATCSGTTTGTFIQRDVNLTVIFDPTFSGSAFTFNGASTHGVVTMQSGATTTDPTSTTLRFTESGATPVTVTVEPNASFGALILSGRATVDIAGTVASVATNSSNSSVTVDGTVTGNITMLGGNASLELDPTGSFAHATANNSNNNFVLGGAGSASFDVTTFSGFNRLFKEGTSTWTLTGGRSGNQSWTIDSGTLIVDGATAFTGPVTINAGTLVVGDAQNPGATIGGAVTLNSGLMQGFGTINNDVTNVGGTVQPGGSIGTLTINGNFTQQAGGTLAIALTPATSSALSISGSAELDGTLSLMPTAGAYTRGTIYPIVVTGNGVSGTFATVANTLPELVFQPVYGANEVDLVLTAFNFPTLGGTPNQQAVSAALQGAPPGTPLDPLLSTILFLPPAQQNQVLDALASQTATAAPAVIAGDMRNLVTALIDRLGGDTGARGAPSGFAATGAGALAFADEPTPPRGASSAFAAADVVRRDFAAAGALSGPSTVWGRGFGLFGNARGDGNASGVSSTTGGAIVGLDRQIDAETRIGGAASFARTTFALSNLPQSGSADVYSIGLYGRRELGAIFADGAIAAAYDRIDSSRATPSVSAIPLVGATATAASNGLAAGANVGIGHRFALPGLIVEPRLGLDWTHVRQSAFAENNAGVAGLQMPAFDKDLSRTTLGARLSTAVPFAGGTLAPELRLAWAHELLDPVLRVTESFAVAPTSTFVISGVDPGRDAALIAAGASWRPAGNPVLLFGRYDATLSTRGTLQAVTGGLKIAW